MDQVLDRLGRNLLLLRRERRRFARHGHVPPVDAAELIDILPPPAAVAPLSGGPPAAGGADDGAPSREDLGVYNMRRDESAALCASLATHAAVFRRPALAAAARGAGGEAPADGWREACRLLEVPADLVHALAAGAGPSGAEYARTLYAPPEADEPSPVYPLAGREPGSHSSQVGKAARKSPLPRMPVFRAHRRHAVGGSARTVLGDWDSPSQRCQWEWRLAMLACTGPDGPLPLATAAN